MATAPHLFQTMWRKMHLYGSSSEEIRVASLYISLGWWWRRWLW